MPPPNSLPSRPLGKDGPLIPRLGLGHLNNGGGYNSVPDDESRLAFLDQAWEMGQIAWDTANIYGDSEALIGKWFAANPTKRSDIFLSTKFGISFVPGKSHGIDSTPENCRRSCEAALAKLQTSYIDLFYIHRLDLKTPIEQTMRVMVELKNEGKVRYFGLSEPSAESLRRAYSIHPISVVQMEYSPFVTELEEPERNFLSTTRELGVAIIAYSPLGRGLLTGAITSRGDLTKPGDFRSMSGLPWFQEGNMEKNIELVKKISALAEKKGVTAAQLVLAWILKQGDDFFAIPGTRSVERLKENLKAMEVEVTDEEESVIRGLAKQVAGGRVQEMHDKYNFADTPLEADQ